MSLTLKASGTQTANVTTEHTLDTDTDSGVYVLVVDTAEMVLGDFLELRIYTKCLVGGASGLAYQASYAQPQAQPLKYSVPVPCNIECKVTLKQTAGVSRDFPWSLLAL